MRARETMEAYEMRSRERGVGEKLGLERGQRGLRTMEERLTFRW